MIQTINYETEYKAEPKSRYTLRCIAEEFREWLKIPSEQLYIDVTEVLELMSDKDSDFSFEIVNDDELGFGVHAKTDVENSKIYLRESVYNGAVEGNGRDRMTIAHEICHILLHHQETLTLYCKEQDDIKLYEKPEWQAECFAAELLMPYLEIKNLSIDEIMEACEVSESAARYQLSHI